MNVSLLARLASLFLLVALCIPSVPAAAADHSPYVRAVSKGRVTLHRPNYGTYKGGRPHNSPVFKFFQRW